LGDETKRDEIGRACSMYGEMRNTYKILVGKPEGMVHWGDINVHMIILKLI